MKTKSVIFSVALLLLVANDPASARTRLPVVMRYEAAEDPELWKKLPKERIPETLVETVEIEDPSRAFAAPYPQVFLQNERMVVCDESCELPQGLKPVRGDGGFEVRRDRSNDEIVRQATVYYWVNQLFDRMQALGFTPQKRLIVRVDRHVKDAELGIESDNNAFFNDKDWSLSFLPASNSLMIKAMGMVFRPSAFDPSVAMHEATHSVFEALIGPILNREVYGLHEAFADYFSLSVLGSPKLGLLITSGKPMRRADQLMAYQPNMEAHDLGAVVSAILWHIRALFADPMEADHIALETIRKVSRNPYAAASDVIAAYFEAFAENASAQTRADARVSAAITQIWEVTGLKATPVEVDLAAVRNRPASGRPYTVSTISLEVPAWTKKEYGLADESVKLGLLDHFEGPTPNTRWYRVSVEDETRATAIWILYSLERTAILQAYDLALQLVTPDQSWAYGKLLKLSSAFGDLINWNESFGSELASLRINGQDMRKLWKVKDAGVRSVGLEIADQTLAAQAHTKAISTTIRAKLIGLIAGKEARAMLGRIERLEFYTVGPDEVARVPGLARLPEYSPGRRIVGLSMTGRTGMVQKFLLNDIR